MSIIPASLPQRNVIRNISALSATLVGTLALGAFTLSYNALQAVAAANGIPGRQSYLWPLLVDFALLVFSLTVVRNALLGETTRWPWTLVGLYTAATIGFNVLHAPANFTAQLVAVVAPISLFLSFETLMAQLKSEVNRATLVNSLADLTAKVDHLAAQRDDLTAHLNTLATRRDALKEEIVNLRRDKVQETAFTLGNLDAANAIRQSQKEEAQTALLAFLSNNPYASLSEAGEAIGRSKTTIGNYVNELTDAGQLHKNGNGWAVTA